MDKFTTGVLQNQRPRKKHVTFSKSPKNSDAVYSIELIELDAAIEETRKKYEELVKKREEIIYANNKKHSYFC